MRVRGCERLRKGEGLASWLTKPAQALGRGRAGVVSPLPDLGSNLKRTPAHRAIRRARNFRTHKASARTSEAPRLRRSDRQRSNSISKL